MTPISSRAAGSTSRCVSPAGCWISESVAPRLTAGVTSRTDCITTAAACLPADQLEGENRARATQLDAVGLRVEDTLDRRMPLE